MFSVRHCPALLGKSRIFPLGAPHVFPPNHDSPFGSSIIHSPVQARPSAPSYPSPLNAQIRFQCVLFLPRCICSAL
eukprot:1041947-Pyramimonas_sp.AAC.1